MARYVAFLRGVNVGKDNVLKMADLVAIAEKAGFENARTVIQSGNVLFESASTEAVVQAALVMPLKKKMGRDIAVVVRTSEELHALLKRNPFPKADGAKVAVLFLQAKPPKARTAQIVGEGPEEVIASGREIFIHYPLGMGRTKLKFQKGAPVGTVRNINTVKKIAALMRA